MKNLEQPAFPLSGEAYRNTGVIGGLTKREYFAAIAMQGLLSSRHIMATDFDKDHVKMYALLSIGLADELLKQISK